MSADHRRPLLAFALVLVVFVIIVVDGLRGQAAVMTALRTGAGHVVQGVRLVAVEAPAPAAPRAVVEPPVPEVAATPSTGGPAAGQPETALAAHAATQPATQAPSPSPAVHGQAVGPDHGASAVVRHTGGPGRAHEPQERGEQGRGTRASGQHDVRHLTHQVEQLVGQHDGLVPGRGPGPDRGRGPGQRDHGEHGRGPEDRGQHGHGVRDREHRAHGHGQHRHDHGRHLGWTRNR